MKKKAEKITIVSSSDFEERERSLKARRTLPTEQKVTRALITQAHNIQHSLFEALERQEQNENGDIVYSSLPSLISELDFRAYMLAAKLILFDQSYICGNEEELSGAYSGEITKIDGREIKTPKGKNYLNGNIYVTLNDLCRVGYGVPDEQNPTTEQRKNMTKTIEAVDSTPIGIIYGNGDERETYLIKVMAKYKRKSDGAIAYHLVLNPIFTTREKGYGLMLRGATTRLSQYLSNKKMRKDASYYAFMELLNIQDRDKVWSINVENLLTKLCLLDSFRKNKKRTISKLEQIFETFVDLGYLLEKPFPILPLDGVYHFKLHPDPKQLIAPSPEAAQEDSDTPQK